MLAGEGMIGDGIAVIGTTGECILDEDACIVEEVGAGDCTHLAIGC